MKAKFEFGDTVWINGIHKATITARSLTPRRLVDEDPRYYPVGADGFFYEAVDHNTQTSFINYTSGLLFTEEEVVKLSLCQ